MADIAPAPQAELTMMQHATFESWQRAARQGYCDGGLCSQAAAAIVDAASTDVAPLVRGPLTHDLMTTFLLLCDLEALAYARLVGEAIFAEGAQLK